MTPALRLASLRQLLAHPWQVGLAVLGVALGVAVALSVDLANESARRAFALAGERVAGRATHHVVGGPSRLPDGLYRTVRVEAGATSAPIVDRMIALVDAPGRALRLLGVDPLAETGFREYAAADGGAASVLPSLMTRPGAVLLAADTAAALGVRQGDPLALALGARRITAEVVGFLDGARGQPGLDDLLVADIATAQELVDSPGRVDRIDLLIPGGASGEAMLSRVRAALPPGAEIVPAAARSHALGEMTRAFNANLTALSLLALFVGLFLVYNTMTFSVVQRRPLLGTLRALGVTRGEILALVLAEALVLGAVATGIGLGLGAVLARTMLALVTRTLNDLYFVIAVRELAWDPVVVGRAVALGVVGTALAALAPAVEASLTTPRAAMTRAVVEGRARRLVPWLAVAGAALAVLGAALLWGAGRGLGTSFAGLFAIFLGAALASPLSTVALLGLAEPPLRALLGPVGRLAARGIAGALSRTGVAVAALMIAVATTVGVTLMITSFRHTVDRWLATSLQADVYVSAPSLVGNRPDASLPPDLVPRLAAVPGIAAIGSSRVVRVESAVGSVLLVVLDYPAEHRRPLGFAVVRAADAWAAWDAGAVFVSEPFAWHRRVGAGDRLSLRTDRGPVDVAVAAVVRDYGATEGVVMMSRRLYEGLWDDREVSSLGIHAAPGVDDATLISALRLAAGPDDVVIRSNRRLRADSLAIFDRTFAVTAVLRLLVTIVAFISVLSALTALALERARELAVLRAAGLTPGEVTRLVLAQSGLVGLAAAVLALPVGVMLAAVLVFVINRRSFGWTMDLVVTPEALVGALALAVGAAVLAAIYPAIRLRRSPLAAALRDE
jgi:putative ABC transport system permease protein